MVIILVALTILTAILVKAILNRMAYRREISLAKLDNTQMSVSPALAIAGTGKLPQFPNDIFYHNGHAWVRIDEGNMVRVGLDDFTQQVMGNIEEIEIPPVGSELNRGGIAWKLRHGKRKLNQLTPLGGTVVAVNEKLRQDPSLVNRSPYEEGWVLKIQPKSLKEEIPNLMDSFQFSKHFDQIKAKLRATFNNEALGVVYGDGEEIIKGAADKLDDKWWSILVTQLFHSFPE